MRKEILGFFIWFAMCMEVSAIGTTSLENLLLGVNARPTGMGEAFCAVPGKLDGIYHNPAAIAGIDNKSMNISYFKSFLDQYYGSFDFGGYTNKKNDILVCGITYFNGGEFEANYVDGTSEKLSAQQDVVLSFGIGTTVKKGPERGMYGVMFKAISSKLVDKYQGYAFALDMGIIGKLSKEFYIGFAYQNLGTKIKYLNTEEKLPEILKAGISCMTDQLTFACDINSRRNEKNSPIRANFGAEYLFKLATDQTKNKYTWLAVRFGYKWNYDNEAPSAGLGILWNEKNEGINYSIQDIGQTIFHRISFNLNLGNIHQ